MRKYTITPEQQNQIDKAFQMIPDRDGWQEKFEMINNSTQQLASKMYGITPPSAEQVLGLRKLEEAMAWFRKAITTHEL